MHHVNSRFLFLATFKLRYGTSESAQAQNPVVRHRRELVARLTTRSGMGAMRRASRLRGLPVRAEGWGVCGDETNGPGEIEHLI
jgi:hypothetical protein